METIRTRQLENEVALLREALRGLQTQVRAHVKFDVKKHFSLMVADVAATKALED